MTTKPRRKPGRRPKSDESLSKQEIVTAAIRILDRDGAEAFSMRNLANELKVYPTAIYWHIANRNALIAEVITKILFDLLPENFESNWREGILGLCRNYRSRIKQHPNIAPLIGVQLVSNASLDFEMIERILSTLEKAGFKNEELRDAYNTVIAAMVGYTTQEFAMVPKESSDAWSEAMKSSIRSVDAERYPTTAGNLGVMENQSYIMRWENGAVAPLDAGFEMFIQAVVDGLEARLQR